MSIIHIGGKHNDFIDIDVLRRENPNSFDKYDGNWLNCDVRLKAGGFSGRIQPSLRTEDFEGFLKGLEEFQKMTQSEARFRTMEECLDIKMNIDNLGHISVVGIALDRPGMGNRFEFSFDIDQSHLPAIISDLRKIVGEYPCRNGNA